MLLPLNELLFKSLIRFRISIGNRVLPLHIPSSATRILKLKGIPYKKELNILMEKAEVLSLIGVKGLKNAFDDRYGEGFQDLEYLEVKYCDDMEHLFGKPKSLSQTNCVSGSFSKLSVLQIDSCQQLRYLFSTAIARGLAKLQELEVRHCEILEEIIRDDQQVMEPIIFHGLKNMVLLRLPKLRRVYFNMNNTSTSTLTQALFNDKIAFPALEVLHIDGLKRPTTICDDQLQSKEAEDSFQSLRYMRVSACSKLMNVFSPSTARRLVHLERLNVSDCEGMIEIVALEMGPSIQYGEVEEEEDLVQIIVFPQLKHISFRNLPNLTRFFYYTGGSKKSLFNHKIAFPALEKLWIRELERPRAIWESFLAKEAQDSFRHSAARCLVHLQELIVCNCEKMEEIVAVEMGQLGEDGEDLVHDDIIVFPQLKNIKFKNLPNLRSFCSSSSRGSKKQGEETVELNIPRVDALFNHKVKFPALKELNIYILDMVGAIWDNELSQGLEVQDFFPQLRLVSKECFEKLKNGIPPNALPWLHKLKIRETWFF